MTDWLAFLEQRQTTLRLPCSLVGELSEKTNQASLLIGSFSLPALKKLPLQSEFRQAEITTGLQTFWKH